MTRPATGKELKFHPMKLDDDVWAAIQALKKNHPTINAGLRLKLGLEHARASRRTLDAVAPPSAATNHPRRRARSRGNERSGSMRIELPCGATAHVSDNIQAPTIEALDAMARAAIKWMEGRDYQHDVTQEMTRQLILGEEPSDGMPDVPTSDSGSPKPSSPADDPVEN